MRLPVGRTILAGVAASLWLGALGCNDSNNVTGPPPAMAVANVAGDWSGTYESDSQAACAASAQLTQQGTRVTGFFYAQSCGIGGAFRGSVSGNTLTGSINMQGCTGGDVSGTVGESGISIQVSDFRRDLATGGPTDVMPGGRVTLTR